MLGSLAKDGVGVTIEVEVVVKIGDVLEGRLELDAVDAIDEKCESIVVESSVLVVGVIQESKVEVEVSLPVYVNPLSVGSILDVRMLLGSWSEDGNNSGASDGSGM